MSKAKVSRGVSCSWHVRFVPNDMWMGLYWRIARSIQSPYKRLDLYVCVIPMLPIRLRFEWGWQS